MSFEQELEQIRNRSGINEQAGGAQQVMQAIGTIQQALALLARNPDAAEVAIQMLGSNPANKQYAQALMALMRAAGQVQLPK